MTVSSTCMTVSTTHIGDFVPYLKTSERQNETPASAFAATTVPALQVALKLPRAPPCFTEAIKISGATLGWGPAPQPPPEQQLHDAAADAPKPLLSNINFVIRRGQRVLVRSGGVWGRM